MKKTYILLLILFLSFAVMSCDFLTSTITLTATTSTDSTTQATSTDSTTQTTLQTTNQTTTETDTTNTTTEIITTTSAATTTEITTTTNSSGVDPIIPTGYNLLQDELEYVGIPSIGNPKVLVIAVDFSDYPSSSSGIDLDDIDTIFNGEDTDLDYESVSSYYQKSSFSQLNLSADIYGYYRAEHPSSYYEDEYERLWATDPITGEWLYEDVTFPDSDLIYEIMLYYDDVIDYSEYDYNQDGYIDGIYIIYTHPVSYYSGSDLWWAYQDIYIYEGDVFDGVEPCYFAWIGDDFLTDNFYGLDARTVIHETGHMMGLDDYYDYYDGDPYNNTGGLGGVDMMDSAYGDHNPFSKILLGWITPIVVEESMTLDISPYELNGDVILLIDEWNGTIFDEYILISFYTPTGLNEEDKNYLYSSSGIIIYHVSAQIDDGYNSDYYYTIFNYNNTDTEYKIIKIIEADMDNHIELYDNAENDDLFLTGDIFGGNIYPHYEWYNGEIVDVDVKIVYMDNSHTTIEFVFGH